ncbi:MAG: hypothetical protein AAGF31_02780 [Planctomycetota bacterium]
MPSSPTPPSATGDTHACKSRSQASLARLESRHEDLLSKIDQLNEQIIAALQQASGSDDEHAQAKAG